MTVDRENISLSLCMQTDNTIMLFHRYAFLVENKMADIPTICFYIIFTRHDLKPYII